MGNFQKEYGESILIDTYLNQSVAEVLRELREEHQWSYTDLAKRMKPSDFPITSDDQRVLCVCGQLTVFRLPHKTKLRCGLYFLHSRRIIINQDQYD